MRYFKNLNKPLENLAFVSLMGSINAIFSLFSALVPLGGLFVMIILPLFSAFVALLCKPLYSLIYFFTGLTLSFALSAWNFQNTLFYVVPSIIVGLIYGMGTKFKVPQSLLIFVLSLIYMGLVYALLPLINFLYGTNPVQLVLTMLNGVDNPFYNDLVMMFIYLYALISVWLPSFIIRGEFEKFKVSFADEKPFYIPHIVLGIIFTILALILPFYAPSASYLFFIISLYFGLLSLMPIIKAGTPYILIPLGALVLLTIFGVAALYSYYPPNSGFVLYSLLATSLNISGLIGVIILARGEKDA